MALVNYDLKNCQCDKPVELQRWEDKPGHFATFVECDCGINMAMRVSKKEDLLAANTIKIWNKRNKRKMMKSGIKTCFCGSKNVNITKYEEHNTVSVICNECYRQTDEMQSDGSWTTEEKAKEIWNNES